LPRSHVRLAGRAADYQPGRRSAAAGTIPSVVDPQCRVIGATGLRVIDASIMPTVGPANTEPHDGHDREEDDAGRR
jgi:hypothetical protein